jgi:hypothetical protein
MHDRESDEKEERSSHPIDQHAKNYSLKCAETQGKFVFKC